MSLGKPTWYFVCTGNICRSAFAEAYLRHLLGDEASVRSGGTGINQALTPPEEILKLADASGLTLETHKPKAIKAGDLQAADIILTATTQHRANVLAESPLSLNKTFTIKEFALLLSHIDLTGISSTNDLREWWQQVVRQAARIRSRVAAEDLDIADPFRESVEVYEKSTQEIMEALNLIASFGNQR